MKQDETIAPKPVVALMDALTKRLQKAAIEIDAPLARRVASTDGGLQND